MEYEVVVHGLAMVVWLDGGREEEGGLPMQMRCARGEKKLVLASVGVV
jgi:hypothetical protein